MRGKLLLIHYSSSQSSLLVSHCRGKSSASGIVLGVLYCKCCSRARPNAIGNNDARPKHCHMSVIDLNNVKAHCLIARSRRTKTAACSRTSELAPRFSLNEGIGRMIGESLIGASVIRQGCDSLLCRRHKCHKQLESWSSSRSLFLCLLYCWAQVLLR